MARLYAQVLGVVLSVRKTNQRVEKLLHAPFCVPFKDLKSRFCSSFGLDF